MTDVAAIPSGGADTPATEPTGAPIEGVVDQPNALGSQTPVAEKPPVEQKPEPAKSPGEAVRKAMDKVKADQAAKEAEKAKAAEVEGKQPKDAKAEPAKDAKAEPAKAEAKTDAKPEQKPAERGPDGKFVAKAGEPAGEQAPTAQQPPQDNAKAGIHEAPTRFDNQAKTDWANVPESVKGATHRTIRELQDGIEEHQRRWEPIKQYDDLAKQYQTNLPDALERYVAMDRLLSEDLAKGVDSILRDKTGGQMGLREFVAHMSGQKPDADASQRDAQNHELTQKVAGLEKKLSDVVQLLMEERQEKVGGTVESFAKDKPDFDALTDQIVKHISEGKSLEAAYEAARQEAEELARSLGFVPAQTNSQPVSPAPQPPPLKPAGQKSVTGAPATGSDPASTQRKNAPATSIREALERARRAVA